MLQHQVLPFLQDRRRRVPVQRVLKDDDIVREQSCLFAVDVDLKVRVLGIQVDQRDAVEAIERLRHGRFTSERSSDGWASRTRIRRIVFDTSSTPCLVSRGRIHLGSGLPYLIRFALSRLSTGPL